MRWDIFRSSILSSIFSLHSQMRNVTPKSTVGIYTNTTRNKELDRESYISFSYIDETARKLLSFQSSRGTIASKWMLYMLLECVLFTVNLFLNPPPPPSPSSHLSISTFVTPPVSRPFSSIIFSRVYLIIMCVVNIADSSFYLTRVGNSTVPDAGGD
jgi:hypothetical protein